MRRVVICSVLVYVDVEGVQSKVDESSQTGVPVAPMDAVMLNGKWGAGTDIRAPVRLQQLGKCRSTGLEVNEDSWHRHEQSQE